MEETARHPVRVAADLAPVAAHAHRVVDLAPVAVLAHRVDSVMARSVRVAVQVSAPDQVPAVLAHRVATLRVEHPRSVRVADVVHHQR
ncbi:hypothetical protein GCM10027580_03020 [Corynebacterium faecale]